MPGTVLDTNADPEFSGPSGDLVLQKGPLVLCLKVIKIKLTVK